MSFKNTRKLNKVKIVLNNITGEILAEMCSEALSDALSGVFPDKEPLTHFVTVGDLKANPNMLVDSNFIEQVVGCVAGRTLHIVCSKHDLDPMEALSLINVTNNAENKASQILLKKYQK